MKVVCALCVFCCLASSSWALDREAFTFTKYDLNVRIEPEQHRLEVRGTITLRNDSTSPQKNLSLQICSSLAWRSIQVASKPVQFVSQPYTSDIDHTGTLSEAIVTLPQEIPTKGSVELEIGYEGVIILDFTRLTHIGVSKEQASHTDWDQIGESFSAVRGIGYVVWYPVATEAASLSDGNSVFETLGRWKVRETKSELRVKLSYSGEGSGDSPVFLSNYGLDASYMTEEMGGSLYVTMTCGFKPLGAAVPLFAMGHFYRVLGPAAAGFYLADHKSAAEDYMNAADRVAPFVAGWFGPAHEKVQLIELADPGAAPYESGSTLLTPLADSPKQAEVAIAHQLTHAAFPSPRLWIYEGLAHFAQALYREQQNGRQAALDFMSAHSATIADAEKTLTTESGNKAFEKQSLINTSVEELYRSKAMYVWWMLRDMVGEPTLKKVLAAYHADEDKEPNYMQRLAEAQTKSDLTWFFDDWVYHDRGLPDFRVDSVYPTATSQGSYMVTVTIENLGGAGAEVPVIVRSQDGEVTKRLQISGKAKNSFRVVIPSYPLEVVVNDGSVPENDMSNNVFKVQPAPESH